MESEEGRQLIEDEARRYRLRYALLTAALFGPLLWAFVEVRNLYPVAASTMMMAGGELGRGRQYYVLRGETVEGQVIDLPPITLTDGLSGRHWGLVTAVVENKQFRIPSPHPANAALEAASGGPGKLPKAARLPDMLRAWGRIYNGRLAADSPARLKSVRLDAYRWSGESYGDYERYVESWQAEL
jgi:hypothetical protein